MEACIMKITGLSIQEAIKAVTDNKARGARRETIGDKRFCVFNNTVDPTYSMTDILNTWELIDPLVTPSPGEVWKGKEGQEYFILELGKMSFFGTTGNYSSDVTSAMIHGQNGWTRVYDPKATEDTKKG